MVDTEEDYEKYSLSLSILNFLKTASNAHLMKKALEGKTYEFK